MSLRQRIAFAAALAVAAVAVTLGVTGYLSTRAHLVGELQQELRGRVAPFLHAHPSGQTPGSPAGSNARSLRNGKPRVPSAPPLGGAPGYFQFVYPNGSAVAGIGGKPELPVDTRVLSIAKQRAEASSGRREFTAYTLRF